MLFLKSTHPRVLFTLDSVVRLYLLTLLFIYKLAFILFVMTPGAQTTGNIAVYGSATALGAFFDALIQRTDVCTEFLWLLVQPHHSIHWSYKRYINRYLSQHMIFQYQDEDSGERVQMYRLARAFSA